MSERGRELVTSNEPTVVAKPSFDAIVVENRQSDGCLPDPTGTYQSGRGEVFRETDDLFDQSITSKEGPRWWRWRFPGCARCNRKILYPPVIEVVSDLF